MTIWLLPISYLLYPRISCILFLNFSVLMNILIVDHSRLTLVSLRIGASSMLAFSAFLLVVWQERDGTMMNDPLSSSIESDLEVAVSIFSAVGDFAGGL